MVEPLNETARAHALFLQYCELGAGRSLAKLAEKCGKSKSYVGQLERWSRDYHWQERVKSYDDEQAAERRRIDGEVVRRVLLKHVLATVEPNANSQLRACVAILQHLALSAELARLEQLNADILRRLEELEQQYKYGQPLELVTLRTNQPGQA